MSEYDGSGDEVLQNEVKQIPVISDIERIKKIAQILEIVGDKVIPLIIDNLPAKSKQTSVPITVDSNEKGLKFLNDLKKELNGVTGGNLEKKVLGE